MDENVEKDYTGCENNKHERWFIKYTKSTLSSHAISNDSSRSSWTHKNVSCFMLYWIETLKISFSCTVFSGAHHVRRFFLNILFIQLRKSKIKYDIYKHSNEQKKETNEGKNLAMMRRVFYHDFASHFYLVCIVGNKPKLLLEIK